MARKNGEDGHSAKKTDRTRRVAVDLAKLGEGRVDATASEIKAARQYLVELASGDGRLELGANLALVKDVVERALATGDLKTSLAALKQQAEILRLYNFSDIDTAARAEASASEQLVRGYLESTGVVKKGLKIEECARRVAAYVVDHILSGGAAGSR